VDIPCAGVIAADGGGSEIVLRDMRSLLGDEHGNIADELTAVLRALAQAAAGGAGPHP